MASKKQKIKDKDRFSILVPSLDRCVICGTTSDIHKHEVFHGVSNRSKSIEDGMVLPVCGYHHNGSSNSLHHNPALEEKFKRNAQKIWMEHYCDDTMTQNEKIEKFISRYGINYLTDEYEI